MRRFAAILVNNRPAKPGKGGLMSNQYGNQLLVLGFLLTSISSVVAQPQQMVFRQSDSVAGSANGIEDISKRTKNARHFLKSNGNWVAVIGQDLNQDDSKGKLTPSVTELWKTVSGWQLQLAGAAATSINANGQGHDLEYEYAGNDDSKHAFILHFPALTYSSGTSFRFTLGT
jgi:hypothetical protein